MSKSAVFRNFRVNQDLSHQLFDLALDARGSDAGVERVVEVVVEVVQEHARRVGIEVLTTGEWPHCIPDLNDLEAALVPPPKPAFVDVEYAVGDDCP